jgi:hypothetical protein
MATDVRLLLGTRGRYGIQIPARSQHHTLVQKCAAGGLRGPLLISQGLCYRYRKTKDYTGDKSVAKYRCLHSYIDTACTSLPTNVKMKMK